MRTLRLTQGLLIIALCLPALQAHSNDTATPHAQDVQQDASVVYLARLEAAQQGNPSEQYSLALMYFYGDRIGQDFVQARQWLHQCAASKHTPCMLGLGLMHMNGLGAKPDPAVAQRWWEACDALNDYQCAYNLGLLHMKGSAGEPDYSRALRYLQRAADHDVPQAFNSLGWMYHHGLGVKPDAQLAERYYLKALQHQDPQAANNLQNLRDGTPLQGAREDSGPHR